MMSYSNDGEDLTADSAMSAPGVASPWGTWRKLGVVYTKCGPQLSRPPSSTSHPETVSDEYNQCVFLRYYTVRKRLGIPRVIKAAAGPHDLGPGSRDNEKPSLDAQHNSDSGSDTVLSPFDNDGEGGRSSVGRIDSEADVVVHNTIAVCFSLFPPILARHD